MIEIITIVGLGVSGMDVAVDMHKETTNKEHRERVRSINHVETRRLEKC